MQAGRLHHKDKELPDTRSHRGPDPRDGAAFEPPSRPALRAAVSDLSWLLGRGYAPVSALKLVGDRQKDRVDVENVLAVQGVPEREHLEMWASRLGVRDRLSRALSGKE